MLYHCELNVNHTRVMDFKLSLTVEVVGKPETLVLNFQIVSFRKEVEFLKAGKYEVKNIELAELMIDHCLNRLKEGNVFGSGFILAMNKDYPHFVVESNYTVVYDSTHADTDLEEE